MVSLPPSVSVLWLQPPNVSSKFQLFSFSFQHKLKFWFATGGAGFCLSRSLASKMLPIAGGGRFETVGDKIRLPDDVTMGYISEHLLNTPLTVVEEFHSHLEPQRFITGDRLSGQISFSYSKYGDEMNVVEVDKIFDASEDPTRLVTSLSGLTLQYCWGRSAHMTSVTWVWPDWAISKSFWQQIYLTKVDLIFGGFWGRFWKTSLLWTFFRKLGLL